GFSGEPAVERWVSARYDGQNYEEEIPIPTGPIDEASLPRLIEDFHVHYEGIYGYRLEAEVIEFVQFTVTVRGSTPSPTLPPAPSGAPGEPVGRRQVWFDKGPIDCAIYRREDLVAGQEITGPAIVEELDSTILIDPGGSMLISAEGLGIVEI
ncbi:MAG: hypothetical protein QF573_09905, partial [Chloroflexota bacterium]|nr:hypothetical protein [Chloroflexota bacterium]